MSEILNIVLLYFCALAKKFLKQNVSNTGYTTCLQFLTSGTSFEPCWKDFRDALYILIQHLNPAKTNLLKQDRFFLLLPFIVVQDYDHRDTTREPTLKINELYMKCSIS